MQTRMLGALEVSTLGLGCMNMTYGYGRSGYGNANDKKAMIALIHRAIERGITFFDTAEAYADNEKLVGEALEGFRDKVVIASKFGIYHKDEKQVLNSSPSQIKQSIENSLKKLRIECLDLYYQHRVDTNTPIEEVAHTMSALIKEGKIKAWGMSEAGLESIKKAHKVCPLSALQSEYSLWWREPEREILGFLAKENIGFVAFSPLGKGFLGGNITKDTTFSSDDFRSRVPRFNKENLAANYTLIEFLSDIASKKNATTAQIALAWIIHTQPIIVPIFGTTNINRLEENIKALEVSFSHEELKEFTQQLSRISIQGDRYPKEFMERVGK